MSDYIELPSETGVVYYVKRWSIERIIQHENKGAVVYIEQNGKDALAIGTALTAVEILAEIENQEKKEDDEREVKMSRRDERIRDAVLKSLKEDKPIQEDPDDIEATIDEMFDE